MLGWSHKLYALPLNFLWLFGRASPLITSDHQPPRGLSGFQSWKIYPLWLPVNHGDTEMAIRHSHLETTRWADRLQRRGKADESADSRHPKIRKKLQQLPAYKNPCLSLWGSQKPRTRAQRNLPGSQHMQGPLQKTREELFAGMIRGEAHSLPKAGRHIHEPTAAFQFPTGELPCMLNISYHSKSTGLSAIRGREAELPLREHIPPKDQAAERQALKEQYLSSKGREGKHLTCTAGTTLKIKLREKRGNRC